MNIGSSPMVSPYTPPFDYPLGFDLPNQSQLSQNPFSDGRMSISVDFGTTFSGVSYGSSRIEGGTIQQILKWPGSDETHRKIPTCLLYDSRGQVVAWGLEAKKYGPIPPGGMRCEWYVLNWLAVMIRVRF
jgi:hypothetical protein